MSIDTAATCLALVQVVDEVALRARVPTALARGMDLVAQTIEMVAGSTRGRVEASVARGTLVTFAAAVDAVAFASELQKSLLEVDWPPTLLVRPEAAAERGPDQRLLHRGLRVRIALHRGRAALGADGLASGPGVYHLARTVAMASGGQVVATDALWRRMKGAVPGTLVVRDLGLHRLQGVDGSGRLFQLLPKALDGRVFLPVGGGVPGTARTLPADEPLLGRQPDLASLEELVSLGVRLVTVVGPAGVGKSRLCRQFARNHIDDPRFPGGVWWIRPGEPRVGALVRAAANALGVPLDEAKTAADAVQRVGYALSWRGRALVVVDHVYRHGRDSDPELATLLDTWIRLARQASFVLHTDVRWGLAGEVSYLLRPLPTGPPDAARHADGVRMFAARARMVDGDFSIDDPATVSEIVARVGGLPLSIRLLAGVVDRFPVEQQLEALRSGALSADAILTAVLEQLDDDERHTLATCSALPGSFEPGLLGLRDQQGDEELSDTPVVVLERRGLVRRSSESAPEIRRYLVESDVRAHVLGGLPVEELRSLRDLRAETLVAACERWSSRAFHRDRPEVVARLVVEWDGLVEAVRSGLDPERDDLEALHVAARAVLVLRPVLEARGPAWFAVELLDATMRKLDAILGADALLQVRVLHMRAATGRRVGRPLQALADLARAESIATRWSDADGLASCLVELGRVHLEQGSHDLGLRALASARQLWTEQGEANGDAVACAYLGSGLMSVGRYEEAEARLHEALGQLRRGEQRFHEARALNYLALLHRRTGRPDSSRSLYRESLRTLRECGVPAMESRVLAEIGLLDLHLQRLGEAREILDEAVDVGRSVGDRSAEAIAHRDLGMVAIVAADLGRGRAELLAAVAIHRDRGDRFGEGADAGCLAWVVHLEGRLDEARSEYRRALELLESSGQARLEALFAGWLAACEAERGDLGAARAALELAELRHAETRDPQIGEALDLLRLPILGRELELAELGADHERSAALQAEIHHASQRLSETGGSTFAVIARRRVLQSRGRRPQGSPPG